MPRGRPRKNNVKDDAFYNASKSSIKKAKVSKKRLNAIFIDMLDFVDPETGFKIELNVYKIKYKNKKRLSIDEEDFINNCYVGYATDYIENLDNGIIPTPLGAAEILDEIEEEDDSLDFDY
jgi:hypothetical protein